MTLKHYFTGLLLLLAFIIQDEYGLKWSWLVEMQNDAVYRQISGIILVVFILHQWHLSLLRMQNKMAIAYHELKRHRWLGVYAPVFFYMHSHSFGYAYLFLLSTIYFSNFVVGLLHPIVCSFKKKTILDGWVTLHVGLSLFLTILISYHIFISYWYQ